MSTKERQISNSLLYMLPILFGSILPLITLPIFTRILTPDDYGVFALAQIYGVFVSGIANLGLIIGYERNFFESHENKFKAELLYSVVGFVAISSGFLIILTFFIQNAVSKSVFNVTIPPNLLIWALGANVLIQLNNYFLMYYRNSENAKQFATYTLIKRGLTLGFSLFFVAYLRIGVLGLAIGPFSGELVVLIMLLGKSLQNLPFSVNRLVLSECLKISLPLTPRIFFKILSTHFDKYMINLLSTLGGVGIYNIGQRISLVVFNGMTALDHVYTPKVYKHMFEEEKRPAGIAIGAYLTTFAYLSVAAAFLAALFSEEAVMLLAPSSYYGAIDIISILSMYYGIMFFGKQPQLIYSKKTYIISILSLVNIILTVSLNIPFILYWGAIGAAWATLLSGIILLTISYTISQYFFYIRWEYQKLIAFYLILFSGAFATILLRHLGIDYLVRVIVKFLFIVIFTYVGVKSRILTFENLILIKNSLIPNRER